MTTVDELSSLHELVRETLREESRSGSGGPDAHSTALIREDGSAVPGAGTPNLPSTAQLQSLIAGLVREEQVLRDQTAALGETVPGPRRSDQPRDTEGGTDKVSPKLTVDQVLSHQQSQSQQQQPAPGVTDSHSQSQRLGSSLSDLELENLRLKHELGVFDPEFFDQLEELKYKYTQLQGIVGEDPVIRVLRDRTREREREGVSPSMHRSIDE